MTANETIWYGMPITDPQSAQVMVAALSFGLAAAVALLAATVWSIAVPGRRLWPPVRSSVSHRVIVWLLTITIFASGIVLGLLDWNGIDLPTAVRWGIGLPLILAGNAVVWYGVTQIGMRATSGAVAELRTNGLYHYSRNPQYLADMGILAGWMVLSASFWVLPLAAAGALVLAVAPLAEERWLLEQYGADYAAYRQGTPRFIGFGSSFDRASGTAGRR